ncbi:MAG: glycosyltransferase family 9 protein, partial [Candidatus Margulisiibacteriota bacterium]
AKEREKSAEIISLCKKKPVNLVEKTTLLELMALIKRFNIYIGADTGPTHLAAALKTPLVMLILAKNVKPVRWAPWNSRHVVIYPHPEAECPLYCDPTKCSESYCSDKVTANRILEAVERLRKNETDTLEDWRKMSFNVLLISEKNDAAEKIVFKAKNKGYNIALLPPKQIKSIKNLLKIIETKNILIIHHLDKKAALTVRLANLLSGIYTTNATVLVRGYQENEDLLTKYNNAFQKALL